MTELRTEHSSPARHEPYRKKHRTTIPNVAGRFVRSPEDPTRLGTEYSRPPSVAHLRVSGLRKVLGPTMTIFIGTGRRCSRSQGLGAPGWSQRLGGG